MLPIRIGKRKIYFLVLVMTGVDNKGRMNRNREVTTTLKPAKDEIKIEI